MNESYKKKQEQFLHLSKVILETHESMVSMATVGDHNLAEMYREQRDIAVEKYLKVQKWLIKNSDM